MVSLARSGDSPESVRALALMLKTQPEFRHLVLTCNPQGSPASTFREDPGVTVIALEDCIRRPKQASSIVYSRGLPYTSRPNRVPLPSVTI